VIKRRPAILLLLLALASCSPRTANVQSRKAIAIVDVTVVDVQRGTGLPHMNVVVDGDRIVSVGPSAEQVPSGASVISGKGRFRIPGLWDMHIHVASDPRALGLLLAAGITGARDMAGDPKQVLETRRRIKSGELDGCSGPHFLDKKGPFLRWWAALKIEESQCPKPARVIHPA